MTSGRTGLARRWRILRTTLFLLGATLTCAAVLPAVSGADTPPSLAGQAGVNPLPPDDPASNVTVHGRGAFANLAIHVTQTANLVHQTIGVNWTGGTPTTTTNHLPGVPFAGFFDNNWLAVFQCWGDPSTSDPLTPANPGPEPTQCEQGGASANGGAYPQSGNLQTAVPAATRIIAPPGSPNFAAYQAAGGVVDSVGELQEPFTAVDGTTIGVSENPLATDPNLHLSFWLNPYFSYNDTNEVPYALTFPDGTGSTLFTTDTGLEAPGLGCGQSVQPLPGGTTGRPRCWLVVVPVSDPATSPVSPAAWTNRIAIPLSFRNVDSPCPFGATERRIEGNELALSAISSWQPALCATRGLTPYNYTVLGDASARSDLPGQTSGGAQLAVATRPLDPATLPPGATPIYAPLTLSALTIGFNIERQPLLDPKTGQLGAAESPDATTRVATVKLTPRLVAKLLTESYPDSLVSMVPTGAYAWAARNAHNLFQDPDFLQFNPEFSLLDAGKGGAQSVHASQLELEFDSSDANAALWQWIYSDREAAAWLAGAPDQSGMEVNPYYSTNPLINPTGVAFQPSSLSDFPKSDPYCLPRPANIVAGEQVPALCVLSWNPYATTVEDAAARTVSTNTGTVTTQNPSPLTASQFWQADGAQPEGQRVVLSVVDSVSAARYGLQTAQLSQDNHDTGSRAFIPATPSTILAGEAAMRPDPSVPSVLDPAPTTTASNAYPLALLSYAAAIPSTMTAADRAAYLPFLSYAAGNGQVSGTAFGQLPPGYAPLPATLTAQARSAITAIEKAPLPGAAPATPAPTSPATPTTTPTTVSVAPAATPAQALPAGAAPVAAPTPPAPTTTAPAAPPATTGATATVTPSTGAPPLRQVLASSPTPATKVSATRWAVLALAVLILAAGLAAIGRRPLARVRNLRQRASNNSSSTPFT